MSSSSSGKFQDHYVFMGVEPHADSDTIQAAYATLAQKYHPNNAETGDPEKFEALNVAYEVLSDPTLRLSFDQMKGIDPDRGDPKFSGEDFFHGLKHATVLRSALLCLLYDRRRLKSSKPSLSMRHLEAMLNGTTEEVGFALWYLKQRGLVVNDDKSSMAISVDGMDYLERNPPLAEDVMKLVKPGSLMTQPSNAAQTPTAQIPPSQPTEPESIRNLMNRALIRTGAAEEAKPVGRR
jgi:hypothetical protein